MYTDNNPLTYILTSAKLDAVGQDWEAALANYNFKLYYKTGKLNVEADALSQIPWQKNQIGMPGFRLPNSYSNHNELHYETPLIEAYVGKTVIPPQKDTLLCGKVGIDQNPLITNQEWTEV